MRTLLQLSYSKIATNVIQGYIQSLNFWEIFYVFVKSIILSTIYRSFCFIISFSISANKNLLSLDFFA